MRIVVTGASRGIGLELVRQLLARGDEVDACVRDPARMRSARFA
jgi:NAD(P)-dependent dehydrogenase (short-subunit alcohol dehydrogenase family)